MDNDQSFDSSVLESYKSEIAQLRKTVSEKEKALQQKNDAIDNLIAHSKDESSVLKTPDYSKFRVDIIGLNEKKLSNGQTYTFQIKGGDYPKGGRWEILVGNKKIENNTFELHADSGDKVTATYYYNGDVVATRIINVK